MLVYAALLRLVSYNHWFLANDLLVLGVGVLQAVALLWHCSRISPYKESKKRGPNAL